MSAQHAATIPPSATRAGLGTPSTIAPTDLAPILLSALIAGVWAELAFVHHHGKAGAMVVSLLLALGFAACFATVALLVPRWGHGRASVAGLGQQLARCSFASLVLGLFLPEYLAKLPPPLLRSALLLTIAGALWLTLCALCVRRARHAPGYAHQDEISTRRLHRFALAGLLLLFTLTTALAIRKYLVFGYVGQDLAYFGQIMHTTLHGHLFWGNLLQDLIYSRPVSTDFAGHNSPIMFLFLPFYALAPSPVTLLVLRNVVLFACAAPVYLLARRRVGPAAAWAWAAAFLLTPAILYQSVFDFYPLTFVALPLLFTLYFYFEQRYTAFCVALALTLVVREDLVFFAFGLGLMALLHRRSLKWTLVPLTAATVWAVLSFLVVLPTALHGATFVTDACFSHLGTRPAQMLRTVILHPRDNVLVHGNIVYLKTLLTGTALVLSFGSPVALLSLPYLAINLLAGAGRCITTIIFAQYSVIPAALLFAGALLTAGKRATPADPALARSARRLPRLGSLGLPLDAAEPLLLMALCCASLVFVTDKAQLDDFRAKSWNAEAAHVLTLVPAQASVAAPRYLLPHLANRDCLYQTHRLLQYHTPMYEYLVLDTDWSHINAAGDYRAQYAEVMQRAANDPTLETIYSSPRYRLYRNPALHGRSCEAAAAPPDPAR